MYHPSNYNIFVVQFDGQVITLSVLRTLYIILYQHEEPIA